jgi:WD40 repeat protein
MGTRSLEVSKDGKKMVSGCEDHSLRIWDYESLKSEKILAGHHDVVVS